MENETSMNAGPSRNAVSIYRAEGPMDDFPVLKAFQQYIDAEQNKARKRMVTLCVFFGAVLCVVIAVFMVMLHDISRRNQILNDRLVEYAMKDRDRVPVVVQQPVAPAVAPAPAPESATAGGAATEAALKAMTDALVAIQKQLNERSVSEPRPAAQEAQPATPAAADDDIERKERLARERIRIERAQIAEERRRLAEERERKHQEEVERHRRKLYPEYYAEREKASAPVTAIEQPPAKREISDDDIADILREAALPEEDEETAVEPEAKAPEAKAEPEKKFDDVGDAIEYFNDDEFKIPVEVKGTSAKWRVPLD